LSSVIPGRKIGTRRSEAYCSRAPGSAQHSRPRALHRAPQLFGAVICEVPLLDMLRYQKFKVGSFWNAARTIFGKMVII